MAYKIRPGIELIQVCGQNMLVASRAVWEDLPRVRPVPRAWAVCWALMKDGRSDEDAVRSFAELFQKPEEEVKGRFDRIFLRLAAEGYLIEENAAPAEENTAAEGPEAVHDAD